MVSQRNYIKRVSILIASLLILVLIIYLLINTGTSKIEVGKVYKAYAYDYDNRLTSGYVYIELVDEDTFVIFSDDVLFPNPNEAFKELYDYSDYISVSIKQGGYTLSKNQYKLFNENIAIADYYDYDEWEKKEPKVYEENYNSYILDDTFVLKKEINGYILTRDYGSGEIKYLLKKVNNKTIPQSIEEFKKEYAKNY